MAICRICGKEDKKLPDEWTAWECPKCFYEMMLAITPWLKHIKKEDLMETVK